MLLNRCSVRWAFGRCVCEGGKVHKHNRGQIVCHTLTSVSWSTTEWMTRHNTSQAVVVGVVRMTLVIIPKPTLSLCLLGHIMFRPGQQIELFSQLNPFPAHWLKFRFTVSFQGPFLAKIGSNATRKHIIELLSWCRQIKPDKDICTVLVFVKVFFVSNSLLFNTIGYILSIRWRI